MKYISIILNLIFLLAIASTSNSQINWSKHIIIENAFSPNSVYAIDVDRDDDVDILTTSFDSNNVVWYENDGNQSFTIHTISDSAYGATQVYAIDIDGDDDIDVLISAELDDRISWYENDGNQNFTSNTISDSADGAMSVYAIDIDRDNDIDVVSANAGGLNQIAWYENDGNQNFTEYIIDDDVDGAGSVYAIDIDGDDDIDVLSGGEDDEYLSWYENDGFTNFTKHIIDTAYGSFPIYALDMDGDNDIDVVSVSTNLPDYKTTSWYERTTSWYENDGGQNFTKHIISENYKYVYPVNVDGDEDVDVIFGNGKIVWYENDGNQNFTENIIDDNGYGIPRLFAIDLDGDDDTDVIYTSYFSKKVIWYENQGTVWVESNDLLGIPTKYQLYQNYPNPFNPNTMIKYSVPQISKVTVKVFDILGNEIETLVNKEKPAGTYEITWYTEGLPSGVYFYRLQAGSFVETKKMVLLR
jgi:hypothetical protein